MPSFATLSTRRQVTLLRPVAMEFCRRYGVAGPRIRLLNHGFNTTFAVTSAAGERFALRLNVNSTRGREEIGAEIAWLQALSADTNLVVPKPAGPVGEVFSEALGRPVFGVMHSWLPGPTGHRFSRPEVARAMGEATVTLHEHARKWQVPTGCRWHPVRNTIFGDTLDLDTRGFIGDIGVYREVLARAEAVLDRLRVEPTRPIHYDLHFGNVKWHRNRLAVFDFDDVILGFPAMDVAVSLFYLRAYANAADLEAAYRQGLGNSIEAFGFDELDCETLVAVRGVGLSNALYQMATSELIAMAPGYAAVTEARLRHFLKTGRFNPSVARLS